MVPSGLPTGTVSSGRAGPSSGRDTDELRRDESHRDPSARIPELERENEALRAAVEQQRRENERIVERYERLLDCDRSRQDRDRDGTATEADASPADRFAAAVARIVRRFGR
jgi:predicted RNase H-like nuclease (RuvC/YqgF family)